MPPVWNQRAPSLPKIVVPVEVARACSWLTAVWPRSEQPTAPRTPKPRSVKLRPLRTVRPTPSYLHPADVDLVDAALVDEVLDQAADGVVGEGGDDGGVAGRSSACRPRATLYSPPPSQTWKARAVWMRPSPGSRRSMTSPRLTRSKRHVGSGLEVEAHGSSTPPGGRRRGPARAATVSSRRGGSMSGRSDQEHRVAVGVEAVALPRPPRRRRRGRARARRRRSRAGGASSGAGGSSSPARRPTRKR